MWRVHRLGRINANIPAKLLFSIAYAKNLGQSDLVRILCAPGEIYNDLTREFGEPVYDLGEAPATPEQKKILERLSPEQVHATDLAGEKIETILTRAPGPSIGN